MKGHTYLNKSADKSCRFAQICMTCKWTTGVIEYKSVFFLECPKSVHGKKCKIYIFCHKKRIILLMHVKLSKET